MANKPLVSAIQSDNQGAVQGAVEVAQAIGGIGQAAVDASNLAREQAKSIASAMKGLSVRTDAATQKNIDGLKGQMAALQQLRAENKITENDFARAMESAQKRIQVLSQSLGQDIRSDAEKARDALNGLGVASEQSSQKAIAALQKQSEELGELRQSGELTASEYDRAMEKIAEQIERVNQTMGVDTRTAAQKAEDALKSLGVTSESSAQQSIASLNKQAQELDNLRATGQITGAEYEKAMQSVNERIERVNKSLGTDTRNAAEKAEDALKGLGVTSSASAQQTLQALQKQNQELEQMRAAGDITAEDFSAAMDAVKKRIDGVNQSLGNDTRTAAEKAEDALKNLGVTSETSAQKSLQALQQQSQELATLRQAGEITADAYDKAMKAIGERIERVNQSIGVDTRTAAQKAEDALKGLGVTSEAASQKTIASLNEQIQELGQLRAAGQITAKDYDAAMAKVNASIAQVNQSLGIDTRTAAQKAADAMKSLGIVSNTSASETIAGLNKQVQELDQMRAAGNLTAEDYDRAFKTVQERIERVNQSIGVDTRTAAQKAEDALKALGVTSETSAQKSLQALHQQSQELASLRQSGQITADAYDKAMDAIRKRIESVNQSLGVDTRTAAQKAADALKNLGVTSEAASQEAIAGLNKQVQELAQLKAAGQITAKDYEAAMASLNASIAQVNNSLGVDTRTAAQKAEDALKSLGVTSNASAADIIAGLNKQVQELDQMRAAGNLTAEEYDRAFKTVQERIERVNQTIGVDTRTATQKAEDALKALGVTSEAAGQKTIASLNEQAQELVALRAAGKITAKDYQAAMKRINRSIEEVNQSLGVDTRTAAQKAEDALKAVGVTSEAASQEAIAGLNLQIQELDQLKAAGQITAKDYERAMASVQEKLKRVNEALGNDTRTAAEKAEEAFRGLGITSNNVADKQIADINRQIQELEQLKNQGVITAEEYERAQVAAQTRIRQAQQQSGRAQLSSVEQVEDAMKAFGLTTERVAKEQIADINRQVAELARLRDAGELTADEYRRAFATAQQRIENINRRMAENTENTFRRMGRSAREYGARVTQAGKGMAMAGIATGGAWLGSGAAATKSLADRGLELRRAVTAAGMNPESDADLERFQRFAYAMETKVGIDMGAVGDILKDVNDKIGDYIETGAGHFVDFAEQIAPLYGVKKSDFKSRAESMSKAELEQEAKSKGMDAAELTEILNLEAEKKWRQAAMSLVQAEDAIGFIQNVQTRLEGVGRDKGDKGGAFYMEGFASELMLGGSILQNNGAEAKRLGDQGAAAGGFINSEQLVKIDKLRESLTQVGEAFRGVGIAMMEAGVFDMIISLTSSVSELFKWLSEKMNPAVLKFGIAFGIIAAVVAPLIIIFGLLISAVGVLASAVGMGVGVFMFLSAAVMGIVTGVIVFWDKVKGLWRMIRGMKDEAQEDIDADVNIQKELRVNAQNISPNMDMASLHPVNLSINGDKSMGGFYGSPDAVRQIEEYANRKAVLQPVGVSRAQR